MKRFRFTDVQKLPEIEELIPLYFRLCATNTNILLAPLYVKSSTTKYVHS